MKQQRWDVASRSVYNRKRWDSNQSPSPNRAADKVRQIWTEAASVKKLHAKTREHILRYFLVGEGRAHYIVVRA